MAVLLLLNGFLFLNNYRLKEKLAKTVQRVPILPLAQLLPLLISYGIFVKVKKPTFYALLLIKLQILFRLH